MIRPFVTCTCGRRMWLPYLKNTSETVWSAKEFLAREIVCPECGHVSHYVIRDVRWARGEEIDPVTGSTEVACWLIETGCNDPHCELTIGFHWLTAANSGPEEVRFRTLRLFERGFFKNLICGRGHHPGTKIPAVRRVG